MDVNMIMNFLHLIFIYITKYNIIGKLGNFKNLKSINAWALSMG